MKIKHKILRKINQLFGYEPLSIDKPITLERKQLNKVRVNARMTVDDYRFMESPTEKRRQAKEELAYLLSEEIKKYMRVSSDHNAAKLITTYNAHIDIVVEDEKHEENS